MKKYLLILVFIFSFPLLGDDDKKDPLVTVGYLKKGNIEYWDYNNDGKVDFEIWRNSNADTGSTVMFADTDFDGFYDEKTIWKESFARGTIQAQKIKQPFPPLKKLDKIKIPQNKQYGFRRGRCL